MTELGGVTAVGIKVSCLLIHSQLKNASRVE